MSKPRGSGYFSLTAGLGFLAAFIASFLIDRVSLDPYVAFQGWLIFAAAILIGWGIRRIWTGDERWTVGQATLNFVVGVIAATVALLALVVQANEAR